MKSILRLFLILLVSLAAWNLSIFRLNALDIVDSCPELSRVEFLEKIQVYIDADIASDNSIITFPDLGKNIEIDDQGVFCRGANEASPAFVVDHLYAIGYGGIFQFFVWNMDTSEAQKIANKWFPNGAFVHQIAPDSVVVISMENEGK
ncbi:hypothetical protein [Devosia sp. CAU 1758]